MQVYYCDLTRFQKETADSTVSYINQNNKKETFAEDQYNECAHSSPKAASKADVAWEALTDIQGADYAIIQICPWFLEKVRY